MKINIKYNLALLKAVLVCCPFSEAINSHWTQYRDKEKMKMVVKMKMIVKKTEKEQDENRGER